MAKKVINQKASNSTYFHPDFHIALNYCIEYLHQNFSEEAVREYMMQFANAYFAPLKKALMEKGLLAIKEHFEKIYKIETAVFDMNISCNDLNIHLYESPAVIYIKANGHRVTFLYRETIASVNEEICRNTDYDCEVLDYNDDTGAYHLRFFKR